MPSTPSSAASKSWLPFSPPVAALAGIALVDLLFAVDSVPAILAITDDTFIVFAANAFALLGLRPLLFLVAELVERLYYLKTALAALLVFIGAKLVSAEFVGKIGPEDSLPGSPRSSGRAWSPRSCGSGGRRRRRPESNRCKRLCRPLRSHSATAPGRYRVEEVLSRQPTSPGASKLRRVLHGDVLEDPRLMRAELRILLDSPRQASQSGAQRGSITRLSFGSASIFARSSSLSSKSKTSKFSTRARGRSLRDRRDVRLVEQPAQGDLAGGLAVRVADRAQRLVLRHLAAGERGVGGNHEVPLHREIDEFLLPEERMELDLVGEDRRERQRLAQHPGGDVRDPEVPHQPCLAQLGERAKRLRERDVVVGPVQQQEVDVLDLQPLERSLGRRADAVGGELVTPQLRLRKSSLRGTPPATRPLPTSDSFSYACAVRCAGSRFRAHRRPPPRSLDRGSPRSESELGSVEPWISRARIEASIVVISAPYPRRSLATLRADPRAISSAGRAPPRQGGGHWFEPSIAHYDSPADAGLSPFRVPNRLRLNRLEVSSPAS